MKYAVDRIENEIVILENIENKEKIEVPINNLPSSIKEGSILIYSNNNYELDLEEEKKRRQNIAARFNRLKNK